MSPRISCCLSVRHPVLRHDCPLDMPLFWLVQRDLKPQNLLLSTTKTGALLKIADFGFARSLQPQGLAETLCGSPLYMAPEILQFHKYNAKADLWSVGTILFELVVGEHPIDSLAFTGKVGHRPCN